MRVLTWVAAIVLSVTVLSHKAVAQGPGGGSDPDREQLRVWLQETSGNQISFGLNDSAYIAVFELHANGATELLYPYRTSGQEPPGLRTASLSYLSLGAEEAATAFAGLPAVMEPPCLFIVASREPLNLEQFTTHPLALANALHHVSAYEQPEQALAPLLDPVRPQEPRDWATNTLCQPDIGGLGAVVPWNYPSRNAYYKGYSSYVMANRVAVPLVPTMGVCVIRGGKGGCEPPRVPPHAPPVRPEQGGTHAQVATRGGRATTEKTPPHGIRPGMKPDPVHPLAPAATQPVGGETRSASTAATTEHSSGSANISSGSTYSSYSSGGGERSGGSASSGSSAANYSSSSASSSSSTYSGSSSSAASYSGSSSSGSSSSYGGGSSGGNYGGGGYSGGGGGGGGYSGGGGGGGGYSGGGGGGGYSGGGGASAGGGGGGGHPR